MVIAMRIIGIDKVHRKPMKQRLGTKITNNISKIAQHAQGSNGIVSKIPNVRQIKRQAQQERHKQHRHEIIGISTPV